MNGRGEVQLETGASQLSCTKMIGRILIAAFLIAGLECAHIASPALNKTEQRSGRLNVTRRIRHGTKASYEQYPFVVYLEFPLEEGAYMCTGSFIALRWILTAAHCVVGVETKVGTERYKILLVSVNDGEVPQAGTKKQSHAVHKVRVISVHRHPKYRATFDPEDTGLIELADSIPGVWMISLPAPHEDKPIIDSKLPAKMVGAGMLDPGAPYSRLAWVKGSNCGVPYSPRRGRLHEFRLCSYSDCTLTTTCGGDSGSPLFYGAIFTSHREEDVVIATHAIGNQNCTALRPNESVYDDIQFYASVCDAMPWILTTLGDDYVDTRDIDLRRLWAEHSIT